MIFVNHNFSFPRHLLEKPVALITSGHRQHPRKGSAPGSSNRLKEAPEK